MLTKLIQRGARPGLFLIYLALLAMLVRSQTCSAGKDDNERLPVGNRAAILMVGLTVAITSDLVLPSLVREIIQPFGDGGADIFVHTSALNPVEVSDEDIVDMYSSGLGTSLAGIIVDSHFKASEMVHIRKMPAASHQGRQAAQPNRRCRQHKPDAEVEHNRSSSQKKFARLAAAPPGWEADEADEGGECTGIEIRGEKVWAPRVWEPPANHVAYFQFFRLRALYPLLLAEERRRMSRYSHVIRMRTDTIWYHEWEGVEGIMEVIPPASNSVAVPMGLQHDTFWGDVVWIASRAAARSIFVGFVDMLEQVFADLPACVSAHLSGSYM